MKLRRKARHQVLTVEQVDRGAVDRWQCPNGSRQIDLFL
jgi:hypothetical protein